MIDSVSDFPGTVEHEIHTRNISLVHRRTISEAVGFDRTRAEILNSREV